MATINLGRIKPVFRGAYAGGTAYVVDDIVTHGNESFICIQAGTGNATSNASYWTKLAAKGSDGTDVGTTLTTQGDILYRDSSGLQRLAKGTAGQVLKMNAAANAPEYGTISSDFVKLANGSHTGATDLVIDNLDTSTYKYFRLHMDGMIAETSSTQALYLRYRYNNSGTQTTYAVAAYTYRTKGAHVKGSVGDAGESSSTSEESKIRINWALSQSGVDRHTQSSIIQFSDLATSSHHRDCYIQSFGTLMTGTEYSHYVNGVGICRNISNPFNGFVIYGSNNWKCDYQVYGLK